MTTLFIIIVTDLDLPGLQTNAGRAEPDLRSYHSTPNGRVDFNPCIRVEPC